MPVIGGIVPLHDVRWCDPAFPDLINRCVYCTFNSNTLLRSFHDLSFLVYDLLRFNKTNIQAEMHRYSVVMRHTKETIATTKCLKMIIEKGTSLVYWKLIRTSNKMTGRLSII